VEEDWIEKCCWCRSLTPNSYRVIEKVNHCMIDLSLTLKRLISYIFGFYILCISDHLSSSPFIDCTAS
jgi:hypothetical protein